MTQKAVCEDIRFLLNANSKGVGGTDLFSFQWGSDADGDEIDKQILVIDGEPLQPQGIFGEVKDERETPTFVIQVRGETNEGVKSVHDRARDIYEFMLQQPNQTIDGTDYLAFTPIGGMIPLGKDENNRFSFSMVFFTYRRSIGA